MLSGRFRQWIESVAFLGLNRGAAADGPLCISNRTIGQRIRLWMVIALPFAIVALFMFYTLGDAHPAHPNASQRSMENLPNFDRGGRSARDLDVVEVRIERTAGAAVTGTVRNNTSHAIARAEAVIDLADNSGAQLGAVTVPIENVPARGTATFRLPISQDAAAYGLVREVQ